MAEDLTQWEYTSVQGTGISAINKMGEQGWEACGVFANSQGASTEVLMKRPKKKEQVEYGYNYGR